MATTPGTGGRGTGWCEDAWGPGNARGCEPSGGGDFKRRACGPGIFRVSLPGFLTVGVDKEEPEDLQLCRERAGALKVWAGSRLELTGPERYRNG